MFKSNILSKIFGKADESDDKGGIIQADEHITELEQSNQTLSAENANLNASVTALQAANDTLSKSLSESDANVTQLKAEVDALTAERDALKASEASLKEQLAAKPTGVLTTVVANPEKEAAIAGEEFVEKNKFRTKVDEQADEYVKMSTSKIK